MSTRLSRFAASVMEAAWLAALIVTPAFFNIYSSRIFEPDKLAILRSLALLILACWLVVAYEERALIQDSRRITGLNSGELLKQPLIAPVLGLAVVYILSTLFSVSPQISLWGSYPRLQGAYTTFSYLVIFAAMIANLRRRSQIDRVIGAIILTSLPVSLYGLLQRFQIDPIPWGGDTATRIASTLGNSIFIAAYLIMVFPLTVMRIVESFEALMDEHASTLANFIRATSYVFIAALQLIAIYYSGSRGPWLGLGTSLVVMWLGLSLIWRKRWLTWTGVIAAVLAGAFLVTLNIPGGPLESLRNRPEFGRLGQLLDSESRTGKVRTLIWQGAAALVQPHEPLEYPDGSTDGLNFIRPLLGYGPETMYVAFNRFYPPELAKVEKRNASPDRAHNETWDALVMTGLLGLLVYLGLFTLVIYYALKWLGMVRSKKQRNSFFLIYAISGLSSAMLFGLWKGAAYLGVALPFGMILGVGLYLLLASVKGDLVTAQSPQEKMRQYLLLGLLAAVVAHFMEINFGIAIAATRLHFWVYAALIFLAGYWLPQQEVIISAASVDESLPADGTSTGSGVEANSAKIEEPQQEMVHTEKRRSTGAVGTSARKKRRSVHTAAPILRLGEHMRQMLILAIMLSILISTLGFNFITNSQRNTSVLGVVWQALVRLPDSAGYSFGVLALIFTTWLIGAAVLVSEAVHTQADVTPSTSWLKMFGLILTVSFVTAVIFWLVHAQALAAMAGINATNMDQVLDQVRRSEGLVTRYYLALLLILLLLGYALASGSALHQKYRSQLSPILAGAGLMITLGVAGFTNLRVVQADVAFKTAELFAQPNTWPAAIAIYERAIELAPREDYYYLFLGRAYLEHAKTIEDATESEALFSSAARDLRTAQELNPLNTDHTANLGRLYNMWASISADPQLRLERAQISSNYFSRALSLSPNHARLWDEWAALFLNVLDSPDEAYARLQQALVVDPEYDWTHALLGDYYGRVIAGQSATPEERKTALQNAAQAYAKALQYTGAESVESAYSYALVLGSIYTQLGQPEEAFSAYDLARRMAPAEEIWRVDEALARQYAVLGDPANALLYANQALAAAPEEYQQRIREFLDQISG